jgi:hypothetical protein
VYWHRELPPLDGEAVYEDIIEADSDRVPGTIERAGEVWKRCSALLMERARVRLEQEVDRLGGNYAHISDEHIESHHDDTKDESWLHGRFGYVLYRRIGRK